MQSGIANAAQQWCPQHNEQSGIANAAQQSALQMPLSNLHCKCRSAICISNAAQQSALQMPLSSGAALQANYSYLKASTGFLVADL
jgi:hypothetical protein